jgi:hypothetical protein
MSVLATCLFYEFVDFTKLPIFNQQFFCEQLFVVCGIANQEKSLHTGSNYDI